MAARSRAVILEALRASQRREEAVAKSLDAERIERILELRDRELRASLRDAMAKRRAFAQQQEEWLEHQRLMAAAKSQKIEGDQEAKERARLEIEEAALAFKAKREKQVAKRKAESAAAKERAEKRKQEYLRQRAEEMAKDQSARNEREEVRQFERAVEHAGDPQLALCQGSHIRHPAQSDGEASGSHAKHRQRENHLEEKESTFRGMTGVLHRASSWLSLMVAVSGW
jgi:hypothetical protein